MVCGHFEHYFQINRVFKSNWLIKVIIITLKIIFIIRSILPNNTSHLATFYQILHHVLELHCKSFPDKNIKFIKSFFEVGQLPQMINVQ